MRSFFHFIVPFLCFCFCFFYLLGFLQLDPRLRPRKRKRPLIITCKIKTRRSHSKIRQTRSDNRSQPAILSPDSSHMKSRSGGLSCYFFWKYRRTDQVFGWNHHELWLNNKAKSIERRKSTPGPGASRNEQEAHKHTPIARQPLAWFDWFPFWRFVAGPVVKLRLRRPRELAFRLSLWT